MPRSGKKRTIAIKRAQVRAKALQEQLAQQNTELSDDMIQLKKYGDFAEVRQLNKKYTRWNATREATVDIKVLEALETEGEELLHKAIEVGASIEEKKHRAEQKAAQQEWFTYINDLVMKHCPYIWIDAGDEVESFWFRAEMISPGVVKIPEDDHTAQIGALYWESYEVRDGFVYIQTKLRLDQYDYVLPEIYVQHLAKPDKKTLFQAYRSARSFRIRFKTTKSGELSPCRKGVDCDDTRASHLVRWYHPSRPL